MNLIAFNDKHFASLFYKNELLWIHITFIRHYLSTFNKTIIYGQEYQQNTYFPHETYICIIFMPNRNY